MKTLQRAALTFTAAFAAQAWAHSGHGMPGEVHWHATDTAGLTVIIGAALVAWFLSRGE